ncbi:hypothetical protein FJZ36_18210 [Candidatus Poribacteria bacterium]|nr:hypothetical protein [Candidatus Poribacteria bacterium]
MSAGMRSVGWIAILVLCTAIAVDGKSGVLRDDFEDGDLVGWKAVYPADYPLWKVVNGELTIAQRDMSSVVLAMGDPTWTDYTFECDATLVEDFGQGDVDLFVRVNWPEFMLFGAGDFLGGKNIPFIQIGDFNVGWHDDIKGAFRVYLNRRMQLSDSLL